MTALMFDNSVYVRTVMLHSVNSACGNVTRVVGEGSGMLTSLPDLAGLQAIRSMSLGHGSPNRVSLYMAVYAS